MAIKYIGTSGNDTTGTGTELLPWRTPSKLLANIVAGDEGVFLDGTWNNTPQINFNTSGSTEGNETTLRAETSGGVTFTGTHLMYLGNDWLVIDGFKWSGSTTTPNPISFRRSTGAIYSHCRMTNCSMIEYNRASTSDPQRWVSLYGSYHRVDHCYFSGKTTNYNFIRVVRSGTSAIPNYHQIDYNYFGDRTYPGPGTGGAMQIGEGTGGGSVALGPSYTTVEWNYFNEVDGDNELISNKCSNNVYRYNVFNACRGMLTMRQGSNCEVYSNWFLGAGKASSGGVKLRGAGHKVTNNYFHGLNPTDATINHAIYIGAGDVVPTQPDTDPADPEYMTLLHYEAADNAVIAFNTIIDCPKAITYGEHTINYGGAETNVAPTGVQIVSNILKNSSGNLIYDSGEIAVPSITWATNIANGTLGIADPGDGAFITTATTMTADDGGIYRPSAGGAADGAASSSYATFVTTDIDGQTRAATRDIGCDEISSATITNWPITICDVGPDYDPTGTSGCAASAPSTPADLALSDVALTAVDTCNVTWTHNAAGDDVTSYTIVLTDPSATVTNTNVGYTNAYSLPDISAMNTGAWTCKLYATNHVGDSSQTAAVNFTVSGDGGIPTLHPTDSTPVMDAGTTDSTQVGYTWGAATGATGYLPYFHEANPLPDANFSSGLQTSSSTGWRTVNPALTTTWTLSAGIATRTASALRNKLYTNFFTHYDNACVRFPFTCTAGTMTVGTAFNEYEVISATLGVADTGTTVEVNLTPIESTVSLQTLLVFNPSDDFAGSVGVATTGEVYFAGLTAKATVASPAWTYAVAAGTDVRMSYKAFNAIPVYSDMSLSGLATSDTAAPPAIYSVDDFATVAHNTATEISVLANDTEINVGAMIVDDSVSVPTHGTAVRSSSNTKITYTPTDGYSGIDSFTYVAKDADGATVGGTTTVTVSVQAAAATITLDNISEVSATALSTTLVGMTASHSTNAEITWVISTSTITDVSVNAGTGHPGDKAATLYITPSALEVGTQTITVIIDDGTIQDSQVINVEVASSAVVGTPTAGNISVEAQPNPNITTIDVIPTCHSPGDLTLTIYSVDGDLCREGEAAYTPNGIISNISEILYFLPDAGFVGTESLVYRVSNGTNVSEEGTILIDVLRDIGSTSTQISYIVEPGAGTGFSQSGNIATEAGITSRAGDTLAYEVTLQPTEGTLSVDSSGNYVFTFGTGSSLNLRRL